MSESQIERVAAALLSARKSHTVMDAAELADALKSSPEAYAVQDLVAAGMGASPGVARYWKSGGPSREAMLTHAALPAEGVWASPADARQWPFQLRLIEVEIALRLGRSVTPQQAQGLTAETAVALVDAMTVSIEVVDSRFQQGVQSPAILKLADLQCHGALVLGEWKPFAPREWAAQECVIRIGGNPVERRRGTHSLGDPAWVLPAWLKHATRAGATVPAGTVVTTGTWCGVLPASAGDLVAASFDGIGEASVQL